MVRILAVVRVGAGTAILATALAACGSSGGDGSVNFGTGLDSNHHVTGQKSSFAHSDKLFWSAGLKDTVKENTLSLVVTGPKGQTLESDPHLVSGTKDVNHIWNGPIDLTRFAGVVGAGKYVLTLTSGGKVEASGSFTLA